MSRVRCIALGLSMMIFLLGQSALHCSAAPNGDSLVKSRLCLGFQV